MQFPPIGSQNVQEGNLAPIDLKNLKDRDQVNGLLYIQSHGAKDFQSNSRAPLYGEAYYQGKVLGFKLWDEHLQRIFSSHDLSGRIIHVTGSAGTYNDKLELTVTKVNFDHGVNDLTMFFKSVDIETVFKNFVDFVSQNLSTKAAELLQTIFTEEKLFDPFKMAWAAKQMHDAQIGGLMNHTLKILNLAKTLITNDPRLARWSDLIYFSIIFHDIGKIDELKDNGSYSDISFVTHRTLGIEILANYKEKIVAAFGEQFYYHVIAVVQQHHGEYGDPTTTVWSEIIHLIDMLEATVTGIMDRYENKDYRIKNGQKEIWVGGKNLVIEKQ